MSDQLIQSGAYVIEAVRPTRRFGTDRLAAERPGTARVLLVENNAGRKVASEPSGGDPWAVFVVTTPWDLKLVVPAALTDGGHDWDFQLGGRWTVSDPAVFTLTVADQISPSTPMDSAAVNQMLFGRVEHLVRDVLKKQTIASLRDDQELPPRWWQTRLAEWLNGCGVTAAVDRVAVVSASAEAAAAHRKAVAREASEAVERKRIADAELAEAERQADFIRRRAAVDAQTQISVAKKQEQLAEMDRQRHLARQKFEIDQTAAKLAMDSLVQKHKLARAQDEAKVAEDRVWRQREAEAEYAERRERAGVQTAHEIERKRNELDVLRREGSARAAIVEAELVAAQKLSLTLIAEAAMAEAAAALRVEEMKAESDRATAAHQQAMSAAAAAETRRAQVEADDSARRNRHEQEKHEAELAALRSDQDLSAQERAARIEIAELELAREKREAADAMARGRRAEELHREQIALMVVQRQHLEKVTAAAVIAAGRVQSQETASSQFHAQSAALLSQLMSANPAQTYQASQTLTQTFGVPAGDLTGAGFDAPMAVMVSRLRDHAARAGNPVRIAKRDLLTRDIGARSVHALPIGSTLNFELSSDSPGYLTVVNLGTSGAFVLLAPGPRCPPVGCKVAAGVSTPFPARGLFPMDFKMVEHGPVGWEHVVAFVTDRPLLTPSELGPADVKPIDGSVVQQWIDQLESSAGRWGVGLMSFEVVS